MIQEEYQVSEIGKERASRREMFLKVKRAVPKIQLECQKKKKKLPTIIITKAQTSDSAKLF